MPSRKIGASALAGFITVIGIWAAKNWGHTEIPGEVGGAITGVLSFVAGYFIPEP